MPRPETHPLYQVAALDPQLELIATEQGVVRLRDARSGLWILIASEEGSIMDRWSADEGAPFLRLDADAVSAGPRAIADAIANARLTARREPPKFEIYSSEAEYRAAKAAEQSRNSFPEGENE